MSAYILAHDLGTTGNKAVLYDLEGNLRASFLHEYPTLHPAPGFVEQDPAQWWTAVCVSTRRLMERAGVAAGDIACVCFSAQMMGCLLVDRAGEPLHNMITWADLRAVRQAERIERAVGGAALYGVTGHRVSASYSAAKLLWLMDEAPEAARGAYKMLQAKDFIIHKLTGKFVTDFSDACGTNLFDIRRREWSADILSTLGIDAGLLPDAVASTTVVGGVTDSAARATGLLAGTPVVVGGGDGSCACVGAGVVSAERVYNVIGSSSWISMAAEEPIFDPEMRTFNWVHLDERLYAPCGTMQSAGVSVRWARDELCGEETARARELGVDVYDLVDARVEASPPGARGVLFLPYLMGERSPRWNPEAKACFLGLTVHTGKDDMLRAVMEGVGYNLKVILDAFEGRTAIEEVTVIGGGAKADIWLRILASVWQKRLRIPVVLEEATSAGAAVCGGVGVGAFADFSVAERFVRTDRIVEPDARLAGLYGRMYGTFNRAYDALVGVFGELEGAGREGGL